MAVHALPPETADIPFRSISGGNGAAAGEPVTRGDLELLGRALRKGRSAPLPEGALGEATAEETMRALRLLALDNLLDIVQLRETLAERDAQLRVQTLEADTWRGRALSERAKRRTEAADALRHERELVTLLHQRLIAIDGLSEELAFRRLPWWRRAGKRPPVATAPATPGSAPG